MQLPRDEKLKEDLHNMGILYGLVVAIVVLAFFFSGPIANMISFHAESTAISERPGPQRDYQVP